MPLSYTNDYVETIKRMRRYQGKPFMASAAGPRFHYAIWPASPGQVMVVDGTRERIALAQGATPTHPYATAVLADLRITADQPGWSSRG